jgi:prepilin-type N-terminal cleavage/methylation domain-containing protein
VKSKSQSGVTLIEMMIVVMIIAIISGISFPALTSGLASVRLSSATGSTASFLTSTMNRVERHEQPAAIVISPKENRLAVYTSSSGEKPERELKLPQGIRIEGEEDRRFLLLPGGTMPRMTLVLRNDKGSRRSVQIDPATGVPNVKRMEASPK